MSIPLSDQDKNTLQTAAYGAVSLLAAADSTGSPHKIAAAGAIALSSATGLVGHVLAEKQRGADPIGTSVAAIADQVLPALTQTMGLLEKADPTEADNFRSTVLVAVETAVRARKGEPSPILTDMTGKITAALDAAGVATANSRPAR